MVINLYGAPGTGKSTVANGLISAMKWREMECEIVIEYAKELVWSESFQTLGNQIHVFGEQYNRVYRLLGKVDYIVSDSPILLSSFYNSKYLKSEELDNLILSEHKKMDTLDIFLNRTKRYNTNGRNEDEETADKYALEMKEFLKDMGVSYIEMDADEDTHNKIIDIITSM